MFDFHAEMEKIVQDIRSNPDYILLSHFVPPPASEETIRAVEAKLGFPLDEDWKAFFRKSNGYQLRWADKKSKKYDPEIVGEPHEGPFDVERVDMDEGTVTGCVNILRMEDIFLNTPSFEFGYSAENDGGLELYCGTEIDYKAFQSGLLPFDLYSSVKNIAVFSKNNFLVLVRGNLRTTHYGSLYSSIHAYLELIIKTNGEVMQRNKSFKYTEDFPPQTIMDSFL